MASTGHRARAQPACGGVVRRNNRRHSHHTKNANDKLIATTSASASHGWVKARVSPPITAASSVTDAVQLLTGSGEVLSKARELALMTWLVSATPAPVASMPAPS